MLESTTYKFAKCLQKRFGKIPGVTDKNYITNSYHIRVTENINAFDKLTKEAEFQKLSPGGAISYVEVPNMQGNIPAVLAIIKHIYNTILYAELNTKSDQCEACGYNGEIQIVNKDGKLIWRCPSADVQTRTRCMLPEGLVDILERSIGIREGLRKSQSVYYMYLLTNMKQKRNQ